MIKNIIREVMVGLWGVIFADSGTFDFAYFTMFLKVDGKLALG